MLTRILNTSVIEKGKTKDEGMNREGFDHLQTYQETLQRSVVYFSARFQWRTVYRAPLETDLKIT